MVGLFNSQRGEIDLDAFVVNNITLRGALGSPNVWPETLQLMEAGRICAEPPITARRPLAQAVDVLQWMAGRPSELVKAVLLPLSAQVGDGIVAAASASRRELL